jgi:hypothetical protein
MGIFQTITHVHHQEYCHLNIFRMLQTVSNVLAEYTNTLWW